MEEVNKEVGSISGNKAPESAVNVFKSILIVDDDPITCFLQLNLLRDMGFHGHLQEAYYAEAALQLLENQQANAGTDDLNPLLILLDINMPIVDGLEFLKKLEANQAIDRKNLFVAILTTAISQQDLLTAANYAVTDFLIKPLTEDKILQLMNTVAKGSNF